MKNEFNPVRKRFVIGLIGALLFSGAVLPTPAQAAKPCNKIGATSIVVQNGKKITLDCLQVGKNKEWTQQNSTISKSDLDALVAKYLKQDLEFPRPVSAVKPGIRNAAVVTAGLASSGPARVAVELKIALAKIGWTSKDAYDGKFLPTEQSALIQKVVLEKVDAIFLVAITPSAVQAGIDAAKAAGIVVACILCGPDLPEGMININVDASGAGRGQAEYAVKNSKSTGTIFVYQNLEFATSTLQTAVAAQRVKYLCPKCTVVTPTLTLAESRTTGAAIWTSLLRDYPNGKLDFVILPFDSPAGALAQTAQQLGRTDFGIVGYGALAPFVDMVGIGSPNVAKASITISTPYYAWAAVDQVARTFAKVPLWDGSKMPFGLITKGNYSKYPSGAPFVYPKFDYTKDFPKLWGK